MLLIIMIFNWSVKIFQVIIYVKKKIIPKLANGYNYTDYTIEKV